MLSLNSSYSAEQDAPILAMYFAVEAGKREKKTVDLGFSMCPLATNSLTAKDDWSEFCTAIFGTGNTSSVAQNGWKKEEIKRGGRALNYFILLNIFAWLVPGGDIHHIV